MTMDQMMAQRAAAARQAQMEQAQWEQMRAAQAAYAQHQNLGAQSTHRLPHQMSSRDEPSRAPPKLYRPSTRPTSSAPSTMYEQPRRKRAYNGPSKGSQEAKDMMAKVRLAQLSKLQMDQ